MKNLNDGQKIFIFPSEMRGMPFELKKVVAYEQEFDSANGQSERGPIATYLVEDLFCPEAALQCADFLTGVWGGSAPNEIVLAGENQEARPVTPIDAEAAVELAVREGSEAYFSCFARAQSEVGDWGSRVIWLDVDWTRTRPEHWYPLTNDAEAGRSILILCAVTGIPLPTHVVKHDSGLTAYWLSDSVISMGNWHRLTSRLHNLAVRTETITEVHSQTNIKSMHRLPVPPREGSDGLSSPVLGRAKASMKLTDFLIVDQVYEAHSDSPTCEPFRFMMGTPEMHAAEYMHHLSASGALGHLD